jgi:hypothetical protein
MGIPSVLYDTVLQIVSSQPSAEIKKNYHVENGIVCNLILHNSWRFSSPRIVRVSLVELQDKTIELSVMLLFHRLATRAAYRTMLSPHGFPLAVSDTFWTVQQLHDQLPRVLTGCLDGAVHDEIGQTPVCLQCPNQLRCLTRGSEP